ncbi:BtaManbiosPhlase [Alicyclobacillus kakegawensis]|uniref:BtaManbiosPhlase n=1 Tax=Alicyclobacillus kakegawensis TaxID=392012 RepID=UPI000832BA83|nr:glycoside hydrolase family 130 protein [Alicyclobacillus kakegawensis]
MLTPAQVQPHRPDFEVIGVFNAGTAWYQGEIILLLRVAERPVGWEGGDTRIPIFDTETNKLQIKVIDRTDGTYEFSDTRAIRLKSDSPGTFRYLTSFSYLRIARSRDGRHFTVDPNPFLFPNTPFETFGIEDPRVTQIGDTYYITYSAVSPAGVGVGLAITKDFVNVQRQGLILPPENKDVVILPEKIQGKYYILHRPIGKSIGLPEVWIAESDNLFSWGNHRLLFGLREGKWDDGRIGAGAVPIKTKEGWLELYHGASKRNRYCMGAILLDLEEPWKVLARSEHPILEPEAPYEVDGFFGNVVFSCGVIVQDDEVTMYYGVADTSMACATASLKDILSCLS